MHDPYLVSCPVGLAVWNYTQSSQYPKEIFHLLFAFLPKEYRIRFLLYTQNK